MPDDTLLIAQVQRLSNELDRRVAVHRKVEPYLEGDCPLPPAVTQAKLTNLYRYLMPVAEAPWGSLIVDSKLDRLEVSGIRDAANKSAAEKVWNDAWQTNHMDSESKLGHGAALLDGRCYATVWVNDDGTPDIALDDCTQMIVEYAEGSRHKRVAALRRWNEGDTSYATLYRPEGIYKFKGKDGDANAATDTWERRTVKNENWPLENPFGVVNVVEVAINRRLKPGAFPYARGEFAHCLGLIDRINLLTFLGLVVAFWMGFPLRGVIGEKIRERVLVDDEGEPLLNDDGSQKKEQVPPFEARPDSVAQFENPDAKVFQLDAADRKNLSVYAELDQLAVITKTPRHYFPMEGGMSNLSAEAITASEGSMHSGVTGHKSTLGEGWEEVLRLAGVPLDVQLSPRAEMTWMDHQTRSLAEKADAFLKLQSGPAPLPAFAAAEFALNVSQDTIARWRSESAADPIVRLLDQVQAGNGNGAAVPTG